MKKLSILGSTGSIGTQTLDIVDEHPSFLSVVSIAAGKNVFLMEEQIRKYKPDIAALYDEKAAEELKIKTADTPVKVLSGMDGIMEAASADSDITVGAMVGMIGIRPTAPSGGFGAFSHIPVPERRKAFCCGKDSSDSKRRPLPGQESG